MLRLFLLFILLIIIKMASNFGLYQPLPNSFVISSLKNVEG